VPTLERTTFPWDERKESSTPQTSFLMLEASKMNSLTKIYSSSIKLSKENITSLSSFSFKFKEIAKCNTSLSGKCP
jgi:hypothetical protein